MLRGAFAPGMAARAGQALRPFLRSSPRGSPQVQTVRPPLVRPQLVRRYCDKKPGPNPKKNPNGPGSAPMVPLLVVATGVGGLVVASQLFSEPHVVGISFQEFRNSYLKQGKVHSVEVINGKTAQIHLKKEGDQVIPPITMEIGSVDSFLRQMEQAQWELRFDEKEYVPITHKEQAEFGRMFLTIAPTLLLIGFWIYAMRSMSPLGGGGGGVMNIGKANAAIAKQVGVKTKFADVAGMDEAKGEVMEFVDFLKNPERYKRLGAKVPKGALLVGPPGTGKTMLAKATAGEADVPFFSISGSDFIEMFVGVGPSRVRDLFKQARENLPAIIFIDEIDAIGRKRQSGGFKRGGNDERENTLNQLLVEMDGFQTEQGVVVMASTNRPDILDPALLRPGRFDRQISIDRPDIKGRFDIFRVHLANIKVSKEDMSVDELAKRLATHTPGFVGADIANICNEAALIAARKKQSVVKLSHFEAAIERVIAGLEKKDKVLSPEEKKTVAYHEAGHAIAGWFLEHADPLLKVSIIPRGSAALGYAQYVPKERYLYSTEELLDSMCMTLGGRVAEQLIFGTVTTGATNDLQRVTNQAYSQVTVYGMNEAIGQVSFPREQDEMQFIKPFSEETSEMIDKEVRDLVDRAYERTYKLLTEKRAELEKVAEYLMENEVMDQAHVAQLIGPRPFGNTADLYKEVDALIEANKERQEKEAAEMAEKAKANEEYWADKKKKEEEAEKKKKEEEGETTEEDGKGESGQKEEQEEKGEEGAKDKKEK